MLVQNLLPGAVDRLALDAATLRARRPELIHCSISGYGAEGPYAGKKAYDLLVQCESGLLSTTGSPEEPAKVGISIVDIATGMYAFSGILAALYERERTGVGATLSVAMLDAMGEWMMQPTYLSVYGGKPFERTGARHASIAPYGPYRCADGTVFIGVQSDREWALLCRQILGRPELVEDERCARNTERVAHNQMITGVIETVLARQQVDARGARPRALWHRLRADAHAAGVLRPPPAGRSRPLARGRLARGPGARPAAARRDGGPGGGHG